MPDQFIVLVGTLLILAGFVLAFLALTVPAVRDGRAKMRGGAVIIIGPFPIVFGSDRQAVRALLVLAIVLVVVLIGLFLLRPFL